MSLCWRGLRPARDSPRADQVWGCSWKTGAGRPEVFPGCRLRLSSDERHTYCLHNWCHMCALVFMREVLGGTTGGLTPCNFKALSGFGAAAVRPAASKPSACWHVYVFTCLRSGCQRICWPRQAGAEPPALLQYSAACLRVYTFKCLRRHAVDDLPARWLPVVAPTCFLPFHVWPAPGSEFPGGVSSSPTWLSNEARVHRRIFLPPR